MDRRYVAFSDVVLRDVEHVVVREHSADPEPGPGDEEIIVVEITVACGSWVGGELAEHYSRGDLIVDAPDESGAQVTGTFEQVLYRSRARRHLGAAYTFLTLRTPLAG